MANNNTRKHKHKQKPKRRKNITIRSVNEDLYEQFKSLTELWGKPLGYIFSRIIRHYDEDLGFIAMPKMRKAFIEPPKIEKNKSIEIIEDLEELRVTKEDLQALGEDTKFVFSNINKLTFSRDISTDTFTEYVHVIFDSNIINLPKNIPKLYFYSVIKNREQLKKISLSSDKTKDVTIRNVDADIYDDFVTACKINNQTVGEAVNQLLTRFVIMVELSHIMYHLDDKELSILVISAIDELEVTNQDLEEIGDKKVIFHRVADLTFADDITQENFQKKIVGIYQCKSNKPANVPKLLYYGRKKKHAK